MESKKNYLICGNGFVISDKLKSFNNKCDFNLIGNVSFDEDLYIQIMKEKIDALFIFDNYKYELLQDFVKTIKMSKPAMCICVFSNASEKYTHVDYQYNLENCEDKMYNVLIRVKSPLALNKRTGFFITPQKITELFDLLEIKKCYKGYDYLTAAIEIVCRNPIEYHHNMTKLYNEVSRYYNVSKVSIERCIRNVIEEASLNIDYKKFKNTKYESLTKAIEEPSNGEFVRAIVNFLAEDLYA